VSIKDIEAGNELRYAVRKTSGYLRRLFDLVEPVRRRRFYSICIVVVVTCEAVLAATQGLWLAAWAALTFSCTLAAAHLMRGDRDRSFALSLAVGALTLRWLCIAILQGLLAIKGHGPFVFPDESPNDRVAVELSRVWLGTGPAVPTMDHYLLGPYSTVLAGAYTAGGYTLFAGLPVPVAFGTWTAVLAHRIVSEGLYPGFAWTARTAGILVAIYPSTLAWSCLLLKDSSVAWATTAIVCGVIGVAKSSRSRQRVSPALLLCLGGAWLAGVRTPQAVVIAVFVATWCVWLLLRRTLSSRYLVVVTVVSALLASGTVLVAYRSYDRIPRSLATHRALGRLHARTATIAERPPRSATWGSTFSYLPHGITLMLFRPYPWEASNSAQRASIVGNVLFLLLCAFAAVGALLSWRRGRRAETVLLVGTVIVLWLLFALAEGNAGTAFRHRDAVTPLLLCFAGVALVSARVRFVNRRARRNIEPATESCPRAYS
jgi:hypothetical protein